MKTKFLTTALALVTITGLAACSATPTAEKADAGSSPQVTDYTKSVAYHNAYNVPAHGVALDGYCPVAYFVADKPLKGSKEFSSSHDGITYYFVSAEAKGVFDADPEKYVPAYGGWCALGMAVEDKFPVDPRHYKIVDGRLMLFLKNPGVDALKLWNDGNEAELTAKADKFWAKVQG